MSKSPVSEARKAIAERAKEMDYERGLMIAAVKRWTDFKAQRTREAAIALKTITRRVENRLAQKSDTTT